MTTNDSEGPELESSQPRTPPAASCSGASPVAPGIARRQKLARLSRAVYVIGVLGVLALVVSLRFRVLSPIGISYNTMLVSIAGLIVITIAAGISCFLLRPNPMTGADEQNNNDTAGSRAPSGSAETQPLRRPSQGCLFLFLWAVIQCACWWAITTLSWPTRFVPNEILGGRNQIVIPESITIAFWTQLFIGLAIPNRYRVFALLQLFVAAFMMSRPSFRHQMEFLVSFQIPSFLWAAYWIQFTVLASALWRLSFKPDRTVDESGDEIA